jgi:predicted RNA-binding protein
MYMFYILEDLLYIHVDKDQNIVFTYLVVDYMYTSHILEDLLYIHVDKD